MSGDKLNMAHIPICIFMYFFLFHLKFMIKIVYLKLIKAFVQG